MQCVYRVFPYVDGAADQALCCKWRTHGQGGGVWDTRTRGHVGRAHGRRFLWRDGLVGVLFAQIVVGTVWTGYFLLRTRVITEI